MSEIVQHPRRNIGLARELTATPEAIALQEAIHTAMEAYADYLDRHDLIFDLDTDSGWRDDRPKSVVARWEFHQGSVIALAGGAVHPDFGVMNMRAVFSEIGYVPHFGHSIKNSRIEELALNAIAYSQRFNSLERAF